LHVTQQPHNREKFGDGRVIDKFKGYLSIKKVKSIGGSLGTFGLVVDEIGRFLSCNSERPSKLAQLM
jgi:hypothetical protein